MRCLRRNWFILAWLAVAAGSLSACATLTASQQANLQLELQLAEQIGTDAVSIWCSTSGIVSVVSTNISAKSRVTTFLQNNANAATAACPMIAKIIAIQPATAVPAAATPSPVTAPAT